MNDITHKGHLDMLVLASIRAGSPHGYAIIRNLRDSSGGVFELAEGTIYPLLRRLEQRGHLSSRWSTVEGRRRRVYRLTKSGAQKLAEQQQSWSVFSGAVEAVLLGGT